MPEGSYQLLGQGCFKFQRREQMQPLTNMLHYAQAPKISTPPEDKL